MITYYLIIFVNLLVGFFYSQVRLRSSGQLLFVAVFVVVLQMLLGFRYEVGVDWLNYLYIFERLSASLWHFESYELGYEFINFFSAFAGFGFAGVVSISTLIFLSCSFYGAWRFGVNPFYFFAVVAPYHLVIAGMNFIPQAVALSIFLLSLSFLKEGRLWIYIFLIVVASSFHASAMFLLPLVGACLKKRYFLIGIIPLAMLSIYFYNDLYSQYTSESWVNAGFVLRAGFPVCASVFLLAHIVSGKAYKEGVVFYRMCWAGVLSTCIIIIFSLVSTTMADRFSYYVIILTSLCVIFLSRKRFLGYRYLGSYAFLALFLCSMLAFFVWDLYSEYAPYYLFNHLLLK
ncbi:EpsG family protein [Onishia taeanensis]